MRICLMIEGQEGVTWEQWLSLALACEAHQFDALFRSDHYLSFAREREWGTLDAWTTISALAASTDRIRLGTLVSPVTFRHPSVLARSVVTADHVSAGRVEVGMGAGWFEREHTAYGFPFPEPRERLALLAEQLEVVHRLMDRREEVVDFEGRHYRLGGVTSVPRAVQDPHPPIVVGGQGGRRSVALAARWADEYNIYNRSPEECRAVRARLTEACERAGRDPADVRFSLMTGTLVGSDRTDLERRAARLMARVGHDGHDGRDVAAYLASRRPGELTGTVEEVADQIAAFAATGVERVMLQHLDHQDVEAVALIGTELIPRVAGL